MCHGSQTNYGRKVAQKTSRQWRASKRMRRGIAHNLIRICGSVSVLTLHFFCRLLLLGKNGFYSPDEAALSFRCLCETSAILYSTIGVGGVDIVHR